MQIFINAVKNTTGKFFLFAVLLSASLTVKAQEAPPRPIEIYVSASDGLVFGTFYQGSMGGSIAISPDGARSVTGDVGEVNMGVPFSPAIFQITANPGTIISILGGPAYTLTGSNGGSMMLNIGTTEPSLPYITIVDPPGSTQVRVGGTLTVGSAIANPPGVYTGTFLVTFMQE